MRSSATPLPPITQPPVNRIILETRLTVYFKISGENFQLFGKTWMSDVLVLGQPVLWNSCRQAVQTSVVHFTWYVCISIPS